MLVTKTLLLEEMTFKPNVKAMAITDKSLAQAILENKQEEFI